MCDNYNHNSYFLCVLSEDWDYSGTWHFYEVCDEDEARRLVELLTAKYQYNLPSQYMRFGVSAPSFTDMDMRDIHRERINDIRMALSTEYGNEYALNNTVRHLGELYTEYPGGIYGCDLVYYQFCKKYDRTRQNNVVVQNVDDQTMQSEQHEAKKDTHSIELENQPQANINTEHDEVPDTSSSIKADSNSTDKVDETEVDSKPDIQESDLQQSPQDINAETLSDGKYNPKIKHWDPKDGLTPPVTLKKAIEWYDIKDERTLKIAIKDRTVLAFMIHSRGWCFDLAELYDRNPVAWKEITDAQKAKLANDLKQDKAKQKNT